ncbi:MAG: hypothetical protein ACO1OT_09855, partial [Heyndrickxia sp.]
PNNRRFTIFMMTKMNSEENMIYAYEKGVDDYYDFFTYFYGHHLKMIQATPELPQKNGGEFSRIYYALNKPYYIPDRGITLPFSKYETGKLKEGNGNPASPNYNSLSDYNVNEKDGVIELRIPWMLIQAKDPSQKEFTGDIVKNGEKASTFIDKINIGALYFDDKGSLKDTFPSISKGNLLTMEGYTWRNWNKPKYTERLKQSYYIVKDLYSKYQ